MKATDATIGTQIVRSKGDYVVGRVGTIIEIDTFKNRAQVAWDEAPKSWVSFNALEPTSIPYAIIPPARKDKYTWTNPKYKAL